MLQGFRCTMVSQKILCNVYKEAAKLSNSL